MGNDSILALAREARLNPDGVTANLGGLAPEERVSLLNQAVHGHRHEPYRRYTPNLEDAVLQLVANEYVAPPADRRWEKFFISQNRNANLFHRQYMDVWTQVAVAGEVNFFSKPRLLTYVLQTVSTAGKPALLLKNAPIGTAPRQEDLPIPGLGKIPIYMCGAMEMLPGATAAIRDELRWMHTQGYRWPGAIMVRAEPGGSRQTNLEPCEGLPKFQGSHLRIGAVAERMPCTLRHEDMHEIRSQLPAHVLNRVEVLYDQAMAEDFGLFFNDEYYMIKFLHAGHPMKNSNEFFGSAAHAFTHHADDLVALVQDPSTPQPVRAYATAMWRLLRDEVFHGKVFTQDGQDPFR